MALMCIYRPPPNHLEPYGRRRLNVCVCVCACEAAAEAVSSAPSVSVSVAAVSLLSMSCSNDPPVNSCPLSQSIVSLLLSFSQIVLFDNKQTIKSHPPSPLYSLLFLFSCFERAFNWVSLFLKLIRIARLFLFLFIFVLILI